jgi:ubiquinone/menaquinone biosynthesis C-methylase UbiE
VDRWTDAFYERLRGRLTPELRNSQHLYAERVRALSARAERWLDIGCGHDVVPPWAAGALGGARPHAGVDPDNAALAANRHIRWKAVAFGDQLPFAAGSFDLVTANMVLEHVDDPGRLFREAARVLRPGGTFLVHTPNVRGYTTALARLVPEPLKAIVARLLHGRQAEDVYPTRYRANSGAALSQLGTDAGFAAASVDHVLTSPQLVRVPPLLVAELLVIRALSAEGLRRFRPCIIAVFRRENHPAADAATAATGDRT